MPERLYTVRRVSDGRQVDIRVFDDGEVRLQWVRRAEDATRMSRAAAQCAAAVMTVNDANGDVTIEVAE